ncbi:monocarboxylate transporter 7 isoform X2 [Leptinotarsa decemlineata]|uniref:monocarboxylate transporter 7 isoform X2 n=1 Tax=Leptinotarsa decemlineata TaxID=7539 RepID=UPI003D30788C
MVLRKEPMNGEFKLVPPEGGWGYIVTVSVIIMHLVTIVPLAAFGLLYGQFLSSIGDETTGTTLSNGAFNTVQSFTGLATSFLLKKFSYRKVGLAGAIFFSLGAFSTIFVENLSQLIVTFGILEGLGFGLMYPAVVSAINSYFEIRLNLMMGIAQTFITVGSIVCPPSIAFLSESIGFRNTLTVLAGLTLLNFAAMGVLQPVKWHMKKVPTGINKRPDRIPLDAIPSRDLSDATVERLLNSKTDSPKIVGSDKKQDVKILDFGLLKDPKYLNMSIGLSLCFTADLAFVSIIRMILNNLNFDSVDITVMMMVYFTSDLISRIAFSVVSYFCTVKNRYVFLTGSTLTAIFRIVFIFRDDYTWKIVNLGILGFLRCFIQTPLALVISEEYKDNFSTALSLFMVVSGTVSLAFGPLMSYVKAITHSDAMVIHVLTMAYLICSISWIVELVYKKIKERRKT